MRLLGMLLIACVVLAAAQAAAAALVVALLLALLYSLIAYPRELASALAFVALLELIERHPLVTLGLAALMTVAKLLAGLDQADGPARCEPESSAEAACSSTDG